MLYEYWLKKILYHFLVECEEDSECHLDNTHCDLNSNHCVCNLGFHDNDGICVPNSGNTFFSKTKIHE